MQRRWLTGIFFLGLLCRAATAQPQASGGAVLYRQRCAACHDNSQERVPSRDAIASLSVQEVTKTLTSGSMQQQAAGPGRVRHYRSCRAAESAKYGLGN